MCEIPGPDDTDPLFFCPEREMFGIQITGGGTGIVGVDMEIGDKFHGLRIAKPPMEPKFEVLLQIHRLVQSDPGFWMLDA